MQQHNEFNARSLFFAFIILCIIGVIFALGLVSQSGGQINSGWGATKYMGQGGWSGGRESKRDYGRYYDDDHDDERYRGRYGDHDDD